MRMKHFLALIFVILAVAVFPAGSAAQESESGESVIGRIAGVRIEIYEYPGEKEDLVALARDLADLQVGQELTKTLLARAESVLNMSGRFQEISSEILPAPDGVIVVFRLRPYLLIREIDIKGEYPLFRQEIVNAMTVYVGDPLYEDLPAEQEQLIRQFVLTQGFIDPQVKVRVRGEAPDGSVRLEVVIDNGPFYSLDSLRIRGNRNFSDTRLKTRLGFWWDSLYPGTAGRLLDEAVEESVRNLASYYWRRGYADAETAYAMEKDPQTGKVDVTVVVKEGPKYEIRFIGNSEFWDRTLRNRLALFKEGNVRGSGIRKSIRNIRELYRSNGYPDARITVEEQDEGEGQDARKIVTLIIEEGPQMVVGLVRFTGNTAFDEDTLLKQMEIDDPKIPIIGKALYVPEVLEQDIRAVRTLYLQEGFERVDVKSEIVPHEGDDKVDIVVAITEGPQTLVSSVSFEGLSVISEARARSILMTAPDKPLTSYAIQRDEAALAAEISELGYPHVSVKGFVTRSSDGKSASVKFTVNEGPLVRMGRTYFFGNFKTSKSILDRELDMEPGDPFSLREMIEGQNEIRRMDIFQSVKFRTFGLREIRDEVILLTNLEERRPYYVQTSLGYESNLGFYGSARAGDRNLFGLNKELWTQAEVSQTSERYELGLRAPRIFGTRITSVFNLFFEHLEPFNQEFEVDTFGSTLGFITPLSERLFASLNFRYELRELTNGDLTLEEIQGDMPGADEELFDPRNVFVVTPSLTYDSRDSFTRPTKGLFSTFSVDVSNGLQEDLDDFIRYTLSARTFVSPSENLTLALLCRAGYIASYGRNNVISEDQLFFLGGTLDVRGYDENRFLIDANGDPVGGRISLAGSVEARIYLQYNLELALFFDAGSLRRTFVEPVTDNTRYSYGAGLRYITPIGPVGLLYGRKIDPEPSESPDRWHFSIGYTF